jgi:hypothetical protein
VKDLKDTKKQETNLEKPANPHNPDIENEEPGQSAVGKHTPTQRKQNEERDEHAVR